MKKGKKAIIYKRKKLNILANNKRAIIYDGTDQVALCRISYNLDYWNGHANCNPLIGKHKTISKLTDGRFAIIWSNDNGKHIGRVVTDESALLEIIKVKKFKLLYNKKFIRLKELYEKNQKKYDDVIPENKRINNSKIEEIVIVTKDGFLVGLYSNNSRLKVKNISDLQNPPKNYYRIWSIEDGISEHRKLSELFSSNR